MKADNNRDPAMKKTMTAVFTAALLAAAVSTVTAAPMLADRHVAKGVQCTVCHGPDKANPQEPTTATCTACHNVKALVAKTKNVKPVNPHDFSFSLLSFFGRNSPDFRPFFCRKEKAGSPNGYRLCGQAWMLLEHAL